MQGTECPRSCTKGVTEILAKQETEDRGQDRRKQGPAPGAGLLFDGPQGGGAGEVEEGEDHKT